MNSLTILGRQGDEAQMTDPSDDDHAEAWEERAAILEYDAGMDRESAERMADELLGEKRQ